MARAGAEHDRDPDGVELQARVIAAAPQLMKLAERLAEAASGSPEDCPPGLFDLAARARDILRDAIEVIVSPKEAPAQSA
ncbi:MAG: hypothetical protein ACK5WW_10480 [Brevundimonas sp.]|jgi:hypothetical protein|uniref:hypothetical protein n=1 Tax=Brevundimonas sp. TaxID=1871086 RepID=UPI0022C02FAF|nr:hypothetical protein [Brevundimonas sp.]